MPISPFWDHYEIDYGESYYIQYVGDGVMNGGDEPYIVCNHPYYVKKLSECANHRWIITREESERDDSSIVSL